ncbi:hypothetical protein EDC04DRAFT_2709384, partial [Pisolithus marmoratus]
MRSTHLTRAVDPPDARSEHPILRIHAPTRTHSATGTKSFLPVLEMASTEPDEVEGGDRHDDAPSSGYVDSHGVKKALLADSGDCPPHLHHLCHIRMVLGMLLHPTGYPVDVEGSNRLLKERNAYCAHAAPMQPPPAFSTSSKRFKYLSGGSKMMRIRYNKVRSARR